MRNQVKRRTYEGSNRARQAGDTRRRIAMAAAHLFERDGYAETSIAAIAAEAGVAVPTVYAAMRSKAGVLRAVVDLTIRGNDETVPITRQADWQAMESEEDPRRLLALFARLHRGICEREAGVFAALEAAAGGDPEATRLLAEHDARRHRTQSRVASVLRRKGGLRHGLGARAAADSIWVLASERTYLALVRDRGWRPAAYERWLVDQLVAALL